MILNGSVHYYIEITFFEKCIFIVISQLFDKVKLTVNEVKIRNVFSKN